MSSIRLMLTFDSWCMTNTGTATLMGCEELAYLKLQERYFFVAPEHLNGKSNFLTVCPHT